MRWQQRLIVLGSEESGCRGVMNATVRSGGLLSRRRGKGEAGSAAVLSRAARQRHTSIGGRHTAVSVHRGAHAALLKEETTDLEELWTEGCPSIQEKRWLRTRV